MIQINLLDLYASITIKTDDFESGIDRVKNSISGFSGMNQNAESSVGRLRKALTGVEDGADAAKEAIDDTTESTEGLGTETEKSSKKAAGFADVLKANLLSNVIVSGITALGNAAKNMAGQFIESAAAVKAESSQFEQTFGDFQDEATQAIQRVASEGGILETRLNTLGSRIYAFARSSGGDANESLSLMERALRVAADSAAYYDTSVEDATETLQSFLKGNYENDAALGLSATETTRNAAAMELFGVKFNDLTEIQKQETLLKMVEDSQKLSGAMGQASREADGWENVMGNLNEVWRQFQARVGAPVLENLIPVVQKVTSSFQEWMNNVDWDAFGEKINSFVQMMVENGPTIVAIIAGIGGGFIAWNVATMIQGVVSAIQTFKKANEGATIAQMALNAVMNANPIGIIISLVVGLVTAIVALWTTNEDFRNAVIEIWEKIKNAFADAWEAIKNTFSRWGEFFSGLWDQLTDIFSGVWEWFTGIGEDIVNGIWQGISNMWDSLVGWFNNLWDGLFGGRSVDVSVNQSVNARVDGSHAGGLRSVPFDGYIAELHKGERVLTAREASRYNNRQADVGPIHITVQSVLDGRIIGESTYKYIRNRGRALGV